MIIMNQIKNYVEKIQEKIKFIKIDDFLYWYNGKYYEILKTKKDITDLIYEKFGEEIEFDLEKTKKCAEHLLVIPNIKITKPAEDNGYLGFNNGIYHYNTTTGCKIEFLEFSDKIAITYTLDADYDISTENEYDYNNFSELERHSKTIAIENNPNGKCRNTELFFSQIANGNINIYYRIWEMLACLLVPDPHCKNFFCVTRRF